MWVQPPKHIGAALRQVGHYFRPDMGSRIHTGTPQVLLVLTDGQSQDEVAWAAEELRHKGIDIYSVARVSHFFTSQRQHPVLPKSTDPGTQIPEPNSLGYVHV